MSLFFAPALLAAMCANPADPPKAPVEWYQWRGPDRNGISTETGLLKSWPEAGPPLLWECKGIGDGFATVSVSGGKVFTQGGRSDNKSYVIAIQIESGTEAWSTPTGEAYKNSYGDGPRGTPTVDGDVLYALSGTGDLVCLALSDGKPKWTLNILDKFHAQNPRWGISESPLISGKMLICTPGGEDATIVALDKTTGGTIWTSKGLSDAAAYSSCILFETAGVKQLANLTHKAAVGVALDDGRPLWRYEPVCNKVANIATVIYHDGEVFASTDYEAGCALIKLAPDGDKKVSAKEVYLSRDIQNHHGGVVLVGDHVYGFSGNGSAMLTCMEWKTGKVAWKNRSVGKGSLVYADGALYCVSQDGVVGLVEANPKEYREISRFSVEHGRQYAWAHPVVARGRLFIRTQDKLRCFNISPPKAGDSASK